MRLPFVRSARPRRRLLLCASLLLAAPAMEAPAQPEPPGGAHADSTRQDPAGGWQSVSEPRRFLFVTSRPMSIELVCPTQFLAAAVGSQGEFVGIARRPDVAPGKTGNARYQFQVVRVVMSDARSLRTCFAKALDDPDARCETWERAPAPDSALSKPAKVDPSLPKLGEFVYVEELPEAIEQVPPDYPHWAREKGVDGTVMVQALVGTDGLVKDVRVVKSIPALDDYALAAVKQWRFKPARTKGEPVAVWVGIPVKFTLH